MAGWVNTAGNGSKTIQEIHLAIGMQSRSNNCNEY
jgi:hypothetical protein